MSDSTGHVPRRPPWSEIKARLENSGFRPSRALGQNFLVDENMLRAIARAAELMPGDLVVEVGPGCGVLTAHLVEHGARVIAVELDPRLFAFARDLWGELAIDWIEGDALAGKHALNPELLQRLAGAGAWKLVSNLPYSAGTPILVAASRLEQPPLSATVLLQDDLAERICAAPGTREWGAVSARLQACYLARKLRLVGPQLFWPRPTVDSALVRLDLRPTRPNSAELAQLDRLVGCLFEQRRKTVLNRLESFFGQRARAAAACAALGIDPRARPEQLSVEDLVGLVRRG
ncbi:MAG: ribosomal RNA small subunit methyltransferase A [Planctomycetes bacterium]|nr:ribosomal RNA small subunit methyltransferase A [Planctomycetota bacterium]